MLVKALAWMGVNTSHFYAHENGKTIELFMGERSSLWQQRQPYPLISTVGISSTGASIARNLNFHRCCLIQGPTG